MPCESENLGRLHPQLHHGAEWITQAFVFYSKTILIQFNSEPIQSIFGSTRKFTTCIGLLLAEVLLYEWIMIPSFPHQGGRWLIFTNSNFWQTDLLLYDATTTSDTTKAHTDLPSQDRCKLLTEDLECFEYLNITVLHHETCLHCSLKSQTLHYLHYSHGVQIIAALQH